MNTLEKRLISLQQQLETLSAEVASLLALTSAPTTANILNPDTNISLSKRPFRNAPASQKGLNRFRQLAKESA